MSLGLELFPAAANPRRRGPSVNFNFKNKTMKITIRDCLLTTWSLLAVSFVLASCSLVQLAVGPTQQDYDWFTKLYGHVNKQPEIMELLSKGRDPIHITGDKFYVYCVVSTPSHLSAEPELQAKYGTTRYQLNEIVTLVKATAKSMRMLRFPYTLHVKALERTDWVARISPCGEDIEWCLDRPEDSKRFGTAR